MRCRRPAWVPLLIVAASLALGTTSAAAPAADALPSPLHADDVIAWAKAHRSEISAAKAKAGALAETPKVVSALPDPMVMVSMDHLPFKLTGVNASFLIQQDFPLSGVLGNKKVSAEADARAAGAEVGRVALDVEVEALVAYLMVVERERMQLVLDEQIATAKAIVEATLARLEGGTGSAGDVVRARLDVARLSGERTAVDAELVAARGVLNAMLARAVDASVPATALTVPTNDPPDNQKLLTLAIAKRPELTVLKFKLEKAQADIAVTKSMYNPMAFVRTGPSYTMLAGPGVMLMVGVSVPLWREKLGAGVAEATQISSMVDAETAALRKVIEGEVAMARGAVVAAKIRFETTRDKLVPISRQAVNLQLASYASGQAPLVSVLDALAMLRMTRMEQVVSEIRLGITWVKLGRAVGAPRVAVPS